ncbi:hypothetical protein R70006_06319 [Paraburkholderia domus]|uniref:hypothetical protein n=1 Tax=Paraburkholderia domus TaxID=2793075 RepID=UPI0019116A3F|nr:hypothetical protein [Paraburkholderia domus]MBK5052944.1 hypothetical protein [Burkholderia sp. R-70006]CAE6823462.1 hypothetical protein R70006_06319 [Paraburkholderia domus]
MSKSENTLRAIVRRADIRDCRKHGLASDCELYADERIDAMSNSEFLSVLSDALEELLGNQSSASIEASLPSQQPVDHAEVNDGPSR